MTMCGKLKGVSGLAMVVFYHDQYSRQVEILKNFQRGRIVKNFGHDHCQNPNGGGGGVVRRPRFFDHGHGQTMTIGKIAGCQWPWSFFYHDHGHNLEIFVVK